MGLTYIEIAKLLDMSRRTVARYIADNKINENLKATNAPKTKQQKAFELSEKGYTYTEIARRMKVTKQTVYNWHKKHQPNNNQNQQEV